MLQFYKKKLFWLIYDCAVVHMGQNTAF